MTRNGFQCFVVFSAMACSAFAADVSNLSGSWILNVEKSSWGKRAKPQGVSVNIDHREPVLKYSGVVLTLTDGDGRQFEFSGAIDGKEYPHRDGTIVIRRVNATTTTSAYTSGDKTIVETTRTSVSSDGKTMTRQIETKGPDGVLKWTEVYERK